MTVCVPLRRHPKDRLARTEAKAEQYEKKHEGAMKTVQAKKVAAPPTVEDGDMTGGKLTGEKQNIVLNDSEQEARSENLAT